MKKNDWLVVGIFGCLLISVSAYLYMSKIMSTNVFYVSPAFSAVILFTGLILLVITFLKAER